MNFFKRVWKEIKILALLFKGVFMYPTKNDAKKISKAVCNCNFQDHKEEFEPEELWNFLVDHLKAENAARENKKE